jgi:hypothetical protein
VLLPSSKTDQSGNGDVIGLPFGSGPLTCAYLPWVEVLDHDLGGSAAVRRFVEAASDTEQGGERKHRDHDRAADLLHERRGSLFRPITRHGPLGTTAMSGDAVQS